MVITAEIGQGRRAPELERLIRGRGQYTSDVQLARTAHVSFVRSPYAHARMTHLDTSAARQAPGVIAVFTAADLPASLSDTVPPATADLHPAAPPLLAADEVFCIGEPIAMVVAESAAQAVDAASFVEVDYEIMPAMTDVEAAAAPGAPLVHPELGTNVAATLRRAAGDVETAFQQADRIISVHVEIPRMAAVPMEPLNALVTWDADKRQLTAWLPTQAPWRVHGRLAAALGIPAANVRIIAPDVGGGFGVRGMIYGEYVLVAWAAYQLERPVRWVATRREDFIVTVGSRETIADASLAVDRDGQFLGLRAKVLINRGAFALDPGVSNRVVTLLTGAYRVPATSVEVSGIYTNTRQTGGYRGAGRPEATFICERLVDEAARVLGRDPIELRQQSFVRPQDFPYANNLGTTYDSGDYAACLAKALEAANFSAVRQEQQRRLANGASELIGVGVMSYIEPSAGGWESGRVKVQPDGKVVATVGSATQGQGHATTFAQIIADRLGVRFDDVTIRQGDTADGLPGIGTFGSRSTTLAGGALNEASEEVLGRAKQIAAHLLEASPDDLVVHDGRFSVVGLTADDRVVTWAEVAAAAASGTLPAELNADLSSEGKFDMHAEAFSCGSCVAVVTVDTGTGVVRLCRLVLAHDAGTIVNPRLADAQLHGGLASGAGEALGEWLCYDESGQLLAGSFLDYWLPHAADVPAFEIESLITPSPLNPLGIKGLGEAGTIAAPPAILSAVVDALRPLGVQDLELPLLPERVWKAIQQASTDSVVR